MVTSVAFSRDGMRIVSGSDDYTSKLWDAFPDEEVRTFIGHTADVGEVSFAGAGRALYEWGGNERRFWQLDTGAVIHYHDRKFDPPVDGTNRTTDGRLAVPSGASVLLVDLNFKETPGEKAYRAFKAKPKPWWHKQQLAIAKETGDQYSAVFHAAWLLKLEPDSRAAYDTLKEVHTQLAPEITAILPTVLREAIKLPEPPEPKLPLNDTETDGDTK